MPHVCVIMSENVQQNLVKCGMDLKYMYLSLILIPRKVACFSNDACIFLTYFREIHNLFTLEKIFCIFSIYKKKMWSIDMRKNYLSILR